MSKKLLVSFALLLCLLLLPLSFAVPAEVLVIGGGGGGGNNYGGAGGGGGYIYNTSFDITQGNYTVTVGAGGLGSTTAQTKGAAGQNSFFGNLTVNHTAIGGGAGGGRTGTGTQQPSGAVGGSGGGAAGDSGAAGVGTSGQGFDGGLGINSGTFAAGGGGGALSVGTAGVTNGGRGGNEVNNSITGTAVAYSGGGGGGAGTVAGLGAINAGNGTITGTGTTRHAVNFTGAGGGGGGTGNGNGGDGGTGVVVVKYVTGTVSAVGGTITTSGAYTIHRFTSSSTFNVSAVNLQITAKDVYTNTSLSNFSALISQGNNTLGYQPFSNNVAWYKLDDNTQTASDSSGNANTGTLNGYLFYNANLTASSGVVPAFLVSGGFFGRGLEVSDNDSNTNAGPYAVINTSSQLLFGNTSAWTLMFYAKANGLKTGGNNEQTVFSAGESGGAPGFAIATNRGSSTQFTLYGPSGDKDASSNNVTVGTWNHITVIYNGSSVFTYQNGVHIQNSSWYYPTSARQIFFGARGIGYERNWNGTIDEVRLWNRSLTLTEINAERLSADPINGTNLILSHSFESNLSNASGNFSYDTNNLLSGQINDSFKFDPRDIAIATVSNYVLSNGTRLGLSNSNKMTVSAWIKGSTTSGCILGNGFSGTRSFNMIYNVGSNPTYRLFNSTTSTTLTSSQTISANVWRHIVGTYDAPTMTFYTDGVSTGTSTLGGGILADTGSFQIGGCPNNNFFNGSIDDVRIYNSSLSALEVYFLFQAGAYRIYNYSTTTGSIDTRLPLGSGNYNITLNSTDNGGYFNRLYSNYNFSANIEATMAQSVVSFTATQLISNATIAGANFTSIYLTNTTHYMRAGTYSVNATKSGYFNKAQTVTATALTSSAVTIANMTDTRLNLTIRNAITNATISSWTAQVNISAYGHSQNIITTNGTSLTDLVTGSYTVLVDSSGFALTSSSFNLTAGTNNVTLYVYTSESIGIEFRDEQSGNLITNKTVTIEFIGSAASYNYTTTNGTLYADLITPDSYVVRYYANNYSERFSYITITDRSTQNVTLYLLASTNGTSITVTVLRQDGSQVQAALVKLLKYDLATNSYIVREETLTDYLGTTSVDVEYNSEFYKFIVEYPVGTISLTTDPAYITSTQITLILDSALAGTFYSYIQDAAGDVDFNTATNNFRFTWSDSYSVVANSCMYVYRIEANYTGTFLGSNCSTASSGTLLYQVSNATQAQYYATGYFTIEGNDYFVDEAFADLRNINVWGLLGVLIALALTVTIVTMFLAVSPQAAILSTPVGITITNFAGITQFSAWVPLGVFAIAVVIVFAMGRSK